MVFLQALHLASSNVGNLDLLLSLKKQSFSSFFYFLQQPPKLPLPDVELTLQRYLDAVETFTPTDQLVTTKMNVQNLLEDKQKIQAIMELLQQKFDKEENWVLFSKPKFVLKKLFDMYFCRCINGG